MSSNRLEELDAWDRAAVAMHIIQLVIGLPKGDQRFLAHVITAIAERLPAGQGLSLNDVSDFLTEARELKKSERSE